MQIWQVNSLTSTASANLASKFSLICKSILSTSTASANLASQFPHFHSFFKFGKSILSLPQLLQIWQVNSLCITLLLQIWQVNSLTSTASVNLASKFSHFHSFCKFGKSILSLPQLLKNLASQFSHFHCFCKFGKSILSLSPLYLQIW